MLSDYYHYFVDVKTGGNSSVNLNNSNSADDNELDDTDGDVEDDDIYLVWKPKKHTKSSKNKINLYELILRNKWNSLNWLIIDKFKLPRIQALTTCITTENYNLALNLFDVNTDAFFADLYSYKLENGRSVLHYLCLHESTNSNHFYKLLLGKIFSITNRKYARSVEQLLYAKDDYLCLPIHYACLTHNFTLINHMFNFLKSIYQIEYANKCSELLVAHMDCKLQCAYSLLYWAIGKKTYSPDCLSRICEFTKLSSLNTNLNSIRACYPLNDACHFEYDTEKDDSYVQLLANSNCEPMLTSPLLYAINQQDETMCDYLIHQVKLSVNQYDSLKVNSLMHAIRVNNINLVKILFSKTNEINLYDSDSNAQTFLHHLANPLGVYNYSFVNIDLLKYILYESGCVFDKDKFTTFSHQLDSKSQSAIGYAFMSGNLEFVRQILVFLNSTLCFDEFILGKKSEFMVCDQYYTGELF